MKNMQSVVGPRVVRVLFTGGPNGGKTSILEYLRAKFKQSRPGLKVICVPETATALLGIMGDDVKSAIVEGGSGGAFQAAILCNQVGVEKGVEAIIAGLLSGFKEHAASDILVLFDRGVLDGLAFVADPSVWENAVSETGFTVDANSMRLNGFASYDLVVHLQSMASMGGGERYEMVSNETATTRLHTKEQAKEADARIQNVYGGHREYAYVEASDSFDEKCSRVFDLLSGLLR